MRRFCECDSSLAAAGKFDLALSQWQVLSGSFTGPIPRKQKGVMLGCNSKAILLLLVFRDVYKGLHLRTGYMEELNGCYGQYYLIKTLEALCEKN